MNSGSNFLHGNSFKKDYKKRRVMVHFTPLAYEDECSLIKTPHLHRCSINITISTGKDHYYYNYITLGRLEYKCDKINEAMKYFSSLQNSRKKFIEVLEPLLMENSL